MEPEVIDAREVRAKARRPKQKSDRRDAFEICDGLRRGIYSSIVHIPPAETRKLREALQQRRHFVRLKSGQMSAVKYMLRSKGLRRLYRSLKTDVAWEHILREPEIPEETKEYIRMHYQIWSSGKLQVEEIERKIEDLKHPYKESAKRLQRVPGVGPITALTTLAVLSDVSRFPTMKHAASYVGIVPQTYNSGDRKNRTGRITKRGSA